MASSLIAAPRVELSSLRLPRALRALWVPTPLDDDAIIETMTRTHASRGGRPTSRWLLVGLRRN